MLRRMFGGACRENRKCVACGVEIRGDEQEFDWTNSGNLTLYFHRGSVGRIPPGSLDRSPHGRLPTRSAQNGVRESSHIEARPPMAVTVLAQVEIVAGAMQPDRQQADAAPVVEPANGQAPARASPR